MNSYVLYALPLTLVMVTMMVRQAAGQLRLCRRVHQRCFQLCGGYLIPLGIVFELTQQQAGKATQRSNTPTPNARRAIHARLSRTSPDPNANAYNPPNVNNLHPSS